MKEHWSKAVLVLFGVAAVAVLLVGPLQRWSSAEPRYQGHSLSFWIGQLDTPKRKKAQQALRAIGPKAVSTLLTKLRNGEALHAETVTALACLGPGAVPDLVSAFDDPAASVRLAAIAAIRALKKDIGPQLSQVIAGLINLINDANAEVQFGAILALQGFGPISAPAVPTLVGVLSEIDFGSADEWLHLRAKAAEALGRIGPEAKSAIPALTGLLTDADRYTRHHAAFALWQISHDTNLVVAALSGMLTETNASMRQMAALTLARISSETNLSADLRETIEATKPQAAVRLMPDSKLSQNQDKTFESVTQDEPIP